MRYVACLVLSAACSAIAGTGAAAFEPLDGTFVAEGACAATIRIRDTAGTAVLPGDEFGLLGANRSDATHYQIRMPGVGDRWVPVACGRVVAGEGGSGGSDPVGSREYVLAVSWQPAFCESHGDKPECATQTADRFDATHFTLHGLWPQPRSAVYCGVDRATEALDRPDTWRRLPPVELSAELRAALDEVMPGTQSALERHEWIKHGTCYGSPQEAYFEQAVRLLRQLNDSSVRAVLAGRIGGEVSAAQLAELFDLSFGEGAGERVAMDCDRDGGRELVVELRLNLAGEITAESRLADLLASAPTARPECSIGLIDPVGQDD